MADEPTLIELDARNRASLGKLARHRRYLAKLESDGTIVLTPAAVVPLDMRTEAEKFRDAGIGPSWPSDPGYAEAEAARVKVAFCNWCPEPEKPSPAYHPDGQPEHVEDVRRSILYQAGRDIVGAMTLGLLGAPPGAAERARVEAGKLPTVGHWDDPSDNIGPTGHGVTAAPYGDDEPDEANYRDRIQDADDDRERMARAFWQDYASERDA